MMQVERGNMYFRADNRAVQGRNRAGLQKMSFLKKLGNIMVCRGCQGSQGRKGRFFQLFARARAYFILYFFIFFCPFCPEKNKRKKKHRKNEGLKENRKIWNLP